MAYYNWEDILKSKTNDELIEFCRNDFIDTYGILNALDELERRRYDHDKFLQLGEELLNSRIKIKDQIQRVTYKEQSLKYSPYVLYGLSLIFLLLFLASGHYNLNSTYLFPFIFFGIGGSLNLYTSKWELKKIEKERNKKLEEISKIIDKITTHKKRTMTHQVLKN
jgi:hypothetical protein